MSLNSKNLKRSHVVNRKQPQCSSTYHAARTHPNIHKPKNVYQLCIVHRASGFFIETVATAVSPTGSLSQPHTEAESNYITTIKKKLVPQLITQMIFLNWGIESRRGQAL